MHKEHQAMDPVVWGIYFSYTDGSEACMGWAGSEKAAVAAAERKISSMRGRRPAHAIPNYRVEIIPRMD